jgi:hypothetical protein
VRLRAGGSLFRVDLLRLRSAAPNPVTAPLSPGSVADTGTAHRATRDGVRLSLSGPGTLVLGESFNTGWRAYCDGRSLGAPRVADGYANGWDVRPPCANVRFEFAPSTPVHWLQIASALGCLVLLAIALRRRRRGPQPAAASHAALPDLPPSKTTLRRALAWGAAAAAVLGFCFSLRAGVAIFAGVSVIVWLGVAPRLLAMAAGALLAVVVPALYLLFPARDFGGYNPGYAGEHIAAHWVGVAAYTLLAIALVQMLSTASRRGEGAARSTP